MCATGQLSQPGGLLPDTSKISTVLITQCFQRGLSDPIDPPDPLPSLLQPGHEPAGRQPSPRGQTALLCV